MAQFAMLAHHYESKPFSGWYVSRKLNGWRVLWDGCTRGKPVSEIPWASAKSEGLSTGLWTLGRHSGPQVVHAPWWWLDRLPINIPLDGELWHEADDTSYIKRVAGQGEEASKFDPRWHDIKYMVFNSKPYVLWGLKDMQQNPFYSNGPWHVRMSAVQSSTLVSSTLQFLTQRPVYTISDLHAFRQQLPEKIEGLMLLNPSAYYTCSRSHDLLKIKSVYETEAKIIQHSNGVGKHEGRMGALFCELTWDSKVVSVYGGKREHINKTVRFAVGGGFSDVQRDWDYVHEHYPIGGELSFTYIGVTDAGIPYTCNALS